MAGKLTKDLMLSKTNHEALSPRLCSGYVSHPWLLLLAATLMLSACGSNSTPVQSGPSLAGNWEFSNLSPPLGASFIGGLQGGFLLQNGSSITGQAVYSISLPSSSGSPTLCDSGTATINGTITGQAVQLTAVGGSPLTGLGETFALTGTLGSDSSGNAIFTVSPYTYTPTAPQGGTPCGNSETVTPAQSQVFSVPPLTGVFQGFFHSTSTNQDFPVSGAFNQGPNIGAASATVTGTVLFNDFPCFGNASLTGTISGNSVLLQVFSSSGPAGQIGQTPGISNPSAVTFDSTQGGGYVVHNASGAKSGQNGWGYFMYTKSCSDVGNLCLALGGSTSCSQPVTLTPFALTFPPQLLGSAARVRKTITLTNNTGSQLSGLTLKLADNVSNLFYSTGGDFNGVPNFTEQDTCSQQGTINLSPGSSCDIDVNFSPQESCPWLPQSSGTANQGAAPAQCPLPLTGTLTVTVPTGSADADNEFSVPIKGTGLSQLVPSVPEIDFGWEALGEASPPQTLTFTNQGPSPVAILPLAEIVPVGPPCVYSAASQPPAETRPPVSNVPPPVPPGIQPIVSGIQLAETANVGLINSAPILNQMSISPPLVNAPTVDFFCETDPPPSKGGSGLPNIQISNDECSGQTLAPFGQQGNSCSVKVTFVPQPATWAAALHSNFGLDDFLQLNSVWCGDANNLSQPNCEVDSGRFPVEIKTNPPSSLRMFPSAGMDFGSVVKGTRSNPLSITIFNDPEDPNAGAANFTAKLPPGADYTESDNCLPTLASNESCTVTVLFTPTVVGLDPGKITFTYNTSTQIALVQTIYLRGTGM